jgi:hypothetical protein
MYAHYLDKLGMPASNFPVMYSYEAVDPGMSTDTECGASCILCSNEVPSSDAGDEPPLIVSDGVEVLKLSGLMPMAMASSSGISASGSHL